jgi:hypothetical protein
VGENFRKLEDTYAVIGCPNNLVSELIRQLITVKIAVGKQLSNLNFRKISDYSLENLIS